MICVICVYISYLIFKDYGQFILSAFGCIVTTYIQGYKDQIKAIDLSAVNFSTSKAFNLNTIIIIFALVCIYVAFA